MRPVKQPPLRLRSLTDHLPLHLVHQLSRLSDFRVRRETISNTVRPVNWTCSLLLILGTLHLTCFASVGNPGTQQGTLSVKDNLAKAHHSQGDTVKPGHSTVRLTTANPRRYR